MQRPASPRRRHDGEAAHAARLRVGAQSEPAPRGGEGTRNRRRGDRRKPGATTARAQNLCRKPTSTRQPPRGWPGSARSGLARNISAEVLRPTTAESPSPTDMARPWVT